ncbi:MAG: hypothetical protein NTW95_10825 [Candidatus Aminicenantes bacterium]|nr:hypothetical protein [Candidatus Aminicenantes bacterium]
MKKSVLPVVILMAISILFMGTIIGASSEAKDPTNVKTDSPGAQVATVEMVQVSPANDTGNWRGPGVAEDSKGNRLVILRGPEGTKFYYSYCPKNGTWSAPAVIYGAQPTLVDYGSSYIEIDSRDNFHCMWENANGQVYASFKNGVWTAPATIPRIGKYDKTSGMTVDSTDQVVTIDCEIVNTFIKEAYLHRKGKNDATFGAPFNISRDGVTASTQPHLAVDSEDHVWAVWKSDYKIPDIDENLVIYLSEFNKDNSDAGDWYVVSPNPAWSFLPQVAVNSEDKIMTLFSTSTSGDYLTRYFDPATQKMSAIIPLNNGLVFFPWHTFFSRMVSHGKDFYAAVMAPGRVLLLYKFNQTAARWDKVAAVSDRAVEVWSLYSGYDHMLVAWNSIEEPTQVFVSTIEVDPFSKVRIKSVSNLRVTKFVERSFFKGYTLNTLTWEANPDNTEKGLVITAHRIYRKSSTEDNTKWARITEVAGTVFKYDDRNIPADSDYVYAVTCVDDQAHESLVF